MKENKFISFIKNNLLLLCILISIIVGFVIGIILKSYEWPNKDSLLWFTLPGMMFIRALEMLIVPVIFVGN